MTRRKAAITAACLLAAPGLAACNHRYCDPPYYAWDDAAAVGSFKIDQLPDGDHRLASVVDSVRGSDFVALFYGHAGPDKARNQTIEELLVRAEQDGLPVLTFADLAVGGPPRAGVVLAFDDAEIDEWYDLRDLLARHHARMSLFVTRYSIWDDEQRAKLHTLYVEGNSVEAHSVHHLDANAYIAEHGMEDYLTTEVQPSIDILRADGFTPVAYAHPFGSHTWQLDEAIASRIRFVRATSGRPKM